MKTTKTDPFLRTAIGIIIMAIALILFASLSLSAQMVAKGKVHSDSKYEVYIQDFNRSNQPVWVRWEPWEWYQNYHIKVDKYDRITAVWIDACTRDTLAVAHFNGALKKRKYKKLITLDGSTYEVGKWPFEALLNKGDSAVATEPLNGSSPVN